MASTGERGAYDEEAPPIYTNRDNLPSYQAASAAQEPPPSYDSLYGRLKQVKSESPGVLSFLKSFIIIVISTIGFTILIAIFMAIPVSMLVMGSIHLHDCSAERMIPIYLIVGGCFGIVKNLFSLIQRCRKSEEEREEEQKKINPLESVVNCFLFAWFIAGCVFIYRTRDHFQTTHSNLPTYCDYELYWFAFWITTSVFIILGASCCCVVCVGCLAAICGNDD